MHLISQVPGGDEAIALADKFGWEAALVICMIAALMVGIWRFGNKALETHQKHLTKNEEIEAMRAKSDAKTADAVELLARDSDRKEKMLVSVDTKVESVEAKVDMMVSFIRSAMEVAIDLTPEDKPEIKKKFERAIKDLQEK